MYCAVHGTDPGQLGQPLDGVVGIVMAAAVEAERRPTLRLRQRDDAPGSRRHDAEPGDVVDARRRDRAADGVSRCSSGNGVTIGSPKASTKRQAIVVAAFTVTC